MIGFKDTKKIRLPDGTAIYCLRSAEAVVLDDHINGYFNHGISLSEGDVIVDVGANIGVFGIRAFQKFENIEIHSFEPIPEIYNVLKKNSILSKNDKFYAYEMGLGAKSETLTFTYFPNSPALSTSNPEMWINDPDSFRKAVKGSLNNAPGSFWWSKLIPDFLVPVLAWYLMRGKKEINCRISTLSEFVEKKNVTSIDLLKMDCEGHEWEVIKGISDNHWPIIKSIVMEIHDVNGRALKIKNLLAEKGFSNIILEKEKALRDTDLINLYATE